MKSNDFTLVAHAKSVRLDKHVGHQVEVTGNFPQAAMMGTSGTAETPAAGTMGTPGAETREQGTTGSSALNVTSLRMIAKTCR